MVKVRRGWSWPLLLVLVGCPSGEKKATEPEAKPTEPTKQAITKAPPPAVQIPEIVLPPGDGPAAVVGDAEVPRETFNAEYKQTLERYYRARHDVKPALMERLKDNIMRRLVDAELIRQQAKALKVTVDEAEFAEKWKAHRDRYGSEEGFKSFLERAGTTAEDVERQFRDNMLREKVFAKVSEDIEVTDKEVRAFYDENERRYQEPEKVKASHILVKVPPKAPAQEVDAAKAKAEEALKKVKGGEDFAKVAEVYSQDNTKDRGGDLGYFIKGRMVKEFENAVWEAKVGEVVGPVKTQFGWHVIKKTDHAKERKRPFSEVSEQIHRSLQARKRNQAIRDALEKWREETKIVVNIKGDESVIRANAPTMQRDLKPRSLEKLQIKKLPPQVTNDDPTK